MIGEVIAMLLVVIVLILPFCLWPIFIAEAVNTSNKILDKKEDDNSCIDELLKEE